jgi:hypothetical protein
MFNGQVEQDKFILNCLNNKLNGYFLEIGSNDPILNNNTYVLESKYNWKGILVEYFEKPWAELYKIHRPNSIAIINDAQNINYKSYFENNNFPENMDYLQIDLEVENLSTLNTLKKIDVELLDKYKFAVVTFEHDIYKGNFHNTREISRQIFNKRGYYCVFQDITNDNNPFEDWYVHPDLVNMEYIKQLQSKNINNYVNHNITGKCLKYKNIIY